MAGYHPPLHGRFCPPNDTEDGKQRLKAVIEAAKKHENWKDILIGFPYVDEVRSGLDLREANLRRADLSGAKLDWADLCGAKLSGADLSEAILGGAKLGGANLFEANLRRADLITTDLNRAQLSGADLSGAALNGAVLCGAKLSGAKLIMADLFDAKLGGANCKGVRLHEKDKWGNTRISNVTFDKKTSFLYVDITRTDWSGAPLLKRQIEDEQWLNAWRRQNKRTRFLYYPIWWLSCDCGRSFLRWALLSLVIASAFGRFYFEYRDSFFLPGGKPLSTAHPLMPFYYSVVTFTTLGFGDVVPDPQNWVMQYVVMLEVVIGYIMLGGLISILANKLARRS